MSPDGEETETPELASTPMNPEAI
jgi:hypothetical protein